MVVCVIKRLSGCVAGVEAAETEEMLSGDDKELLQVQLPAAAEGAGGQQQLE